MPQPEERPSAIQSSRPTPARPKSWGALRARPSRYRSQPRCQEPASAVCCGGTRHRNVRNAGTPRLRAFGRCCGRDVRACILDLLQKNAASLGTLRDREPGKISPRLSRSNAELLRRSDLVLNNSKKRPYPGPAGAGVRSHTSLVIESVPQAFALINKQ
jgi:hypothetical protein